VHWSLHIDFNLCFDLGQKLWVPEVVSVNFTPVRACALGQLGVWEGEFHSAIEETLRGVRRQQLLLSLLEALDFHTLVEWKEIRGLNSRVLVVL
jgi:hypothetical protein